MDAVRIIASLLIASCLAATGIPEHQSTTILAAAPEKPQATPVRPRKALIWMAYEPIVSDDLAMFLPDRLKKIDVIILNNASGPWITPTDADMERREFSSLGKDKQALEALLRKSFLDFVQKGGGIAAIHYAIGANRHWPEFHELMGARMDGHPWNEEVGIKIEEPHHPVLAAFGGKSTVRLADEIFQFREPYDRGKQQILLSIDTATTNMGVKWLRRKDKDWGLAWIRTVGKGRVFYSAIGHRTEIFWNPTVLKFYLDGVQFATGDLEAPSKRSDHTCSGGP
jgi:type 1 glutamine amidotransferase